MATRRGSKPKARPRLTRAKLLAKLKKFDIDFDKYPLVIVGIRGYYLNSMGAVGRNDRGIYDDALFILGKNTFAPFNGNVDPSSYRAKTSRRKGMATLKKGIYYAHRFDNHRTSRSNYPAICQRAGNVIVHRDGDKKLHKGMFGINIHRGGRSTTSSAGCQTIHPDQWDGFYQLSKSIAKRHFGKDWKKRIIPYVLL